MNFYIISQIAKPQAGWAQQYDQNMKPASARTYEPQSVCTYRTIVNIYDLMRFYKITGDRRYLNPITGALEWLDSAAVYDGSKGYTHAGFYEIGTNKPLFYHVEGTSVDDERHWIDYDMTNMYPYRRPDKPDIGKFKRDFERIKSLTPTQQEQNI